MHFLCILSIAIAVAVEIPQIDDHTENRFARVAYGEDYDHEKYEYVVMLLGEDENSSEIASLCSGSLLSPIAVLTAAHCTYGMTASKLTVSNN
jgi:secreted trypsin-like serine protease